MAALKNSLKPDGETSLLTVHSLLSQRPVGGRKPEEKEHGEPSGIWKGHGCFQMQQGTPITLIILFQGGTGAGLGGRAAGVEGVVGGSGGWAGAAGA